MTTEFVSLFIAAFLAATLLPAQSELGLAYLISEHPGEVFSMVAVASLGNTLGSVVNWALGRGVRGLELLQRSRASGEKLARAEAWYQRFGYWSLLLSWAPIIGDPITLVAGLLKEPFWRFLLLVSIAKTARYSIVALLIFGVL